MSSALTKLLKRDDELLFSGNLALLCNQTSFDFKTGKYLFEILAERGTLNQVFIPEHGLFAELQDQHKLDPDNHYQFLNLGASVTSLYGSAESSVAPSIAQLKNIDALVIDIQGVGCRYFSYLSTIQNIFKTVDQVGHSIKVFVIDRPNPAGRQVEGSRMTGEYASFLGIEGLPHRHGLTIGEMCKYLHADLQAGFDLEIIPFNEKEFNQALPIQPSPNFPSAITAQLYSGQCLFEGTILSEGRGTTRPFEIIGAPFLSWEILKKVRSELYKKYPDFNDKIALRPLKFIPTTHKYVGEVCFGFQLHVLSADFHALILSVLLIECINRHCEINIWRQGPYEYGSKKTAIEILVGDREILDFLNHTNQMKDVLPHLSSEEHIWIKKAAEFLIYPFPLFTQEYF